MASRDIGVLGRVDAELAVNSGEGWMAFKSNAGAGERENDPLRFRLTPLPEPGEGRALVGNTRDGVARGSGVDLSPRRRAINMSSFSRASPKVFFSSSVLFGGMVGSTRMVSTRECQSCVMAGCRNGMFGSGDVVG